VSRRPPRGFTLIELLVTIGILAVAAAVLALSVRGAGERRLEEESARLGALFGIAHSEARISGRALVWEADLQGYRFRPLEEGLARDWRDGALRERRWPFEVLRLEGARIVFGREPLLEPAAVVLGTAGGDALLALDPLGRLSVSHCAGERCAASR
jgi:general secretion pathway protein H